MCHNPPLPGLPVHALPLLNHDRTDHNTKLMKHLCIATVSSVNQLLLYDFITLPAMNSSFLHYLLGMIKLWVMKCPFKLWPHDSTDHLKQDLWQQRERPLLWIAHLAVNRMFIVESELKWCNQMRQRSKKDDGWTWKYKLPYKDIDYRTYTSIIL